MNENQFVRGIQKHFEEEGYYSLREIGVGYGIADLVLMKREKINIENCRVRKDHRQFSPLFNENYFKTLKYIPDEDSDDEFVNFKHIAEKSCLSKSYLKYSILKFLELQGYVRRVEKDSYIKVNGWLPIANEIIAIEAKLNDWKRGAIQANRYKAFAHQVYLAIPKNKEHIVDKNYFVKHEIGLIIFNNENQTKKIVIQSKSKEPFDENKFYFALEYFWGEIQSINLA